MSVPAWNWDRLSDTAGPLADATRVPEIRLGKYRVIREIARGAMGVVYEAEDAELQRFVAIKILREIADARDEMRLRFQREALAAAKLDHANVVRVYDSGEDQGRMYLVMELVRGHPLSEIMGGRKVELRPMLFLLEKAARGIAAAHAAGIVHRDVKPANILVTEAGEPKVGDFGLAHWMDASMALTRTEAPLGTPTYMAPEQVRGAAREICPATDVYALGVILYELLTGRPPHTGDSTMEIYSKIVQDEPVAPKRLNSRVPRDVEVICRHALEKDIPRRYPTAREFADDLARYLHGESILARPPGPVEGTWKWMRRHRAASTGVAVALAGAITLTSILAAGAARRREERRQDMARWLKEGDRAFAQYRDTLRSLSRDRVEEVALREKIDPNAGPDLKRPLWTLQRRIEEAERRAVELESAGAVALQSVLKLDPDNVEARRRLVAFHLEQLGQAEAQWRDADAEDHLRWIRFYGAEALPPGTSLEATLQVDSRPAGAEVDLLRYEEAEDRRLVAKPVRNLGKCPVPRTTLPAGSYLLVLRQPGCRDTRYPLRIGCTTDHSAVVRLYGEQEIGKDYVYVPGGAFSMGGDPLAPFAIQDRRMVPVEDFFISTFEVTVGEYVEFLQALGSDPSVTAELSRLAPVDSRWPVSGVSWRNAGAYCLWLTRRAAARGEPATYRLPTSAEWEKAARGTDGRGFPWGNHLDWTFTKGASSTEGKPTPATVGTYAADESPYGVRDMAGSMSEWCSDWFNEEMGVKVMRGGNWGSNPGHRFRCAYVAIAAPDRPTSFLGFRVVKQVPAREH